MHLRSLLAIAITASLSAQNLVYDNGPLATGVSGANVISVLQTAAPLSHNIFGYGAQQAVPNRLVDQFTVNSVLIVDEIEVFGYTTGATTTTCTGVYLSVWDGDPSTGTPNQQIAGGGNAVNLIGAPGFTVTNTLTNIYRVTDTAQTGTTRNIQSVRVALAAPLTLQAGTYYLEFSFNGINFVPPITTRNVASTGDGKQYTNASLAYAPILNGTTATAGLPFKLYSSLGSPYGPGGITNLGGGCSTASLAVGGATTVGGYVRAELSNVNPLAIGAIIIGASNPALPLFICPCTQNASLDILTVSNFFELQIPVNATLVGTQLFFQGAELDIGFSPQPCNVGIGFSLTDGFRYEINFN